MNDYPLNGFFPPHLNDGRHVFVFGSNESGRHGKGAAYTAKKSWGAVNGIGEGIQGASYGIPTKDGQLNTLALARIRWYVETFLRYAKEHPEKIFLVTKIGCGLAGYSESDIAPMFKDAPKNCILPPNWRNERQAYDTDAIKTKT